MELPRSLKVTPTPDLFLFLEEFTVIWAEDLRLKAQSTNIASLSSYVLLHYVFNNKINCPKFTDYIHWNAVLCGRGESGLPQVVSTFNSQRAEVGHLQPGCQEMMLKSGVEHKSHTTVKGRLVSGTQHGVGGDRGSG